MKRAQVLVLISLGVVLTLGVFLAFNFIPEITDSSANAGNTYYLSPTGNDTNAGTLTSPWKNFSYANTKLVAGDTLLLLNGTYTQTMNINKSGTDVSRIIISAAPGASPVLDMGGTIGNAVILSGSYINISNLRIQNTSGTCVKLSGTNINASNLLVNKCVAHGIEVSGKNIVVENSTIYDAVRENLARTASAWGSALKVYVGGENLTLRNNTVYNNYGEGIAVTRGKNVVVKDNFVYDNYAANIYVDNSNYVTVDGNLSTCTANTAYTKNGARPKGVALGIENYSGWGDQFHHITIKNNLVAYCTNGVIFFPSEYSGGYYKDVTIANNTFWGGVAKNAISVEYVAGQRDIKIHNNIAHQALNQVVYIQNMTGVTVSHNFWVNTTVTGNGKGTGDLSGDVKLAMTPIYNDRSSFKLSDISPAINKALTLADVTKDAYGTSRPQGGAFDMGAHEYGSTSTETPPTQEQPTTPTPTTTTVNLNPTQDTYVNSNSPSKNFGKNTALLSKLLGPEIISYQKYDLGSLSGKTIVSAKLKMYVTDATPSTTVQQLYRLANNTWSETTTNYSNKPALLELVSTISGGTIGSVASFDVLIPVTTYKGSEISFAIKNTSKDRMGFPSKESSTNKPYLEVIYE